MRQPSCLFRNMKISQISGWSGSIISVFTLYRRLFWSGLRFIMEWRLSDTAPAVTAMCWDSLSFPAPSIIMTISAPLFVLLLRGVTRRSWRLPCYQRDCANTNTFSWVIDLYLPTFLTAFSSYWQYKHFGWSITFQYRAHSLAFGPPHPAIHSPRPCLISVSLCLASLAICLNKTGQTMVLLISLVFLSLQISGDNIIRAIQWLLFTLRYTDISTIQYSFDMLTLGESVVSLLACLQYWFHHISYIPKAICSYLCPFQTIIGKYIRNQNNENLKAGGIYVCVYIYVFFLSASKFAMLER